MVDTKKPMTIRGEGKLLVIINVLEPWFLSVPSVVGIYWMAHRNQENINGKDIRELLFQHLVGFNKSSQRISFLSLVKNCIFSFSGFF